MSDHEPLSSATDASSSRGDGPSADELLPPIEPPNAGFILQLFVVPAIIVLVIISVWLLFSWVADQGTAKPQDLVAGLRGSGPGRWQRAHQLANMLRHPRGHALKQDHELAAALAATLAAESDVARQQESPTTGSETEEETMTAAIKLRYFLSRTLGEFQVSEGLDVLLIVAESDPAETVRRAALEGLALLVHNLDEAGQHPEESHPQLQSAVLDLSQDDSSLIRSETAFVLGVLAVASLDSTPVVARLREMVSDAHADTRYNAAMALARTGDPASIPIIVEMLDWQVMDSVAEESANSNRIAKRVQIMGNALRATKMLASSNSDDAMQPLLAAVEDLIHADPEELARSSVDQRLVTAAKSILAELNGDARVLNSNDDNDSTDDRG